MLGPRQLDMGNSGYTPIDVTSVQAATTVTNLNDSGAGSLRQAIIDASPGDTIDFGMTGTITLTSGALTVDKNLTITGPTSGSLTIDGNAASEVFTIQSGTVVEVSNLTITNGRNSAGGGVVNIGTLTLRNVTLTGNDAFAGEGGAILNVGTLTAINSTISGNFALTAAAIANRQHFTVTLRNSTVTNNTASTNIGGIRHVGGVGAMTLYNTILAGNTAPTSPDCNGALTSQGYNLIGDESDCTFSAATGDIVGTGASPVNPLLSALADYGGPTKTHRLLTGSPAIDAGNPVTPGSGGTACEATDQKGVLRPQDAACDIGATEHIDPSLVPSLSQWALVGLALLLGAAVYIRRARLMRKPIVV